VPDDLEKTHVSRAGPTLTVGTSMNDVVEFNVQPKDLTAFSYACVARNRVGRRERHFTRIVSVLCAIGLVAFLLVRPDIDREGFNLVAIGLSLLAVYPLIMRLQLWWHLCHALRNGDWRTVLGRHVLSLTPEGIRERSDAGETFYRWHAVTDIFSSHDLIVFLLSSGSGYLVPARSFAGPEAKGAFEERAKRLRTDASGHAERDSSSSMP
jgi:YcxB-like protein